MCMLVRFFFFSLSIIVVYLCVSACVFWGREGYRLTSKGKTPEEELIIPLTSLCFFLFFTSITATQDEKLWKV